MGDRLDYNAIFGLEDEGVNEAEPAGQPETEEAEGENEQLDAEADVIEDGDETEVDTDETEDETGVDTEETEDTGDDTADVDQSEDETDTENTEHKATEQSAEDNAKFAAARRKAESETQSKIEAALAEQKRRYDEMLAEAGFVSPYTSQTVQSTEEFNAYLKARRDEMEKSIIDKSGLSAEELNNFVRNSAPVREAEELKQRLAAEQARKQIENDLDEIRKLDPNIKSFDDLQQHDTAGEMESFLKQGKTLPEAFKLANYERLTQSKIEAARQAAASRAMSKEHLSATKKRGQGAIPVPDDVMKMYRMFGIDKNDAEKHYNREQSKRR